MDLRNKKGLLIAEKNSLMKSIEEIYEKNKAELGYDLDFVCQSGHLLTLVTPDELDESLKVWSWDNLPIKPENHGGFKYKTIPGKESVYEEIKKRLHSGKYDFVIHAGDPDQEGELLINIVLDQAKNTLPVFRFYTNSIADEKILEALKSLRNEVHDEKLKNLLDAAFARQHSDYRVGMNLSRAATLKMNSRVALGRVKTPILSIVVQREDAINNFKQKTVYGVKSLYEPGFEGSLFNDGKNEDDEKNTDLIYFETKKEAQDLIDSLSKTAIVDSCEIKQTKTYADKLFKLSTAQVEANKLFGYKPKKTEEILENLYLKKYTTYPRSSLEYLGSKEDLRGPLEAVCKAFDEFNYIIEGIDDAKIDEIKKNTRFVSDKKVDADAEGHSAIIPTANVPSLNTLTDEEINIYNMIARRYVAIFMPPLIQDKLKLVCDIDGNKFKSTASRVVDEGYMNLYQNKTLANDKFTEYNKGDKINVSEFSISENKSKKPTRFNITDLIELLDNPVKFLDDESLKSLGKIPIGTPATRSGIIEELIKRDKYLKEEKEGKREVLKPTGVGELIIRNLDGVDITKVDMTGLWEEKLTKVRNGELDFDVFEDSMMEDVEKMIEEIKNKDMRAVEDNKNFEKIGVCPKCGGDLIKGPRSFFCSNYKEGCKVGGFSNQSGAEITTDEFLRMLDGEIFNKEFTYKGKSWHQNIGLNEEGTIKPINEEDETDMTCPACGKAIVETKRAYMCVGNKDKSCGVGISKSINGVDITHDMAHDLFTNGKTNKISGFISKAGNPYLAVFEVDKGEKKVKMHAMEPTEETKFECPVCDRALLKGNFTYKCVGNEDSSCNFSMYSQSFNKDIPDSKVSKMLEMVRSGEIGGGEYAYITKEPVETGHTCSFCGGKVMRKDMRFYCENTPKKKCSLDFYRTVGDQIMDDADIENLFMAGKTRVFEFTNSNGEPTSLRKVLDYDKKNVVSKYENIAITSKHSCPICGEKLKKEGLKYTCSCGFDMFAMVGKEKMSEKDLEDLFKYKETTSTYKINTKKGPKKVKLVIDEFERKTALKFM